MARTAAIVLCCSKAGLAIIRALGQQGIDVIGVGYGRGQIGLSSRFLRARYRCVDPAEDETGFIVFVESLATEWAGAVLFPSDDASLVAVSRHKERLSQVFRVITEDWGIVRRLIEKHRTYDIAQRAGIPCPRLQMVTDAHEAGRFAREVGFPCLVKPSVGHLFFKKYRRKMLIVRSAEELGQCIETASSYGGELMLCEFIPGDDTCGANYNSFCAAGAPVREFTAQKIRLKPTLIGFPTAVESRDLPPVRQLGRRMMNALGYTGFSCTEFKRDARDGIYKLMEVNGRHNYSGQLAVACGINFPYLSYLAALEESLPEPGGAQVEGVRWIDEERDVRGALAAVLRGPRAVRAYAAAYRGRKAFAVFSASDLLPSARLIGTSLLSAVGLRRSRTAHP